MKKFKDYIEEELDYFDGWDDTALVTESGLSRVLSQMKNKVFSTLTAFRDEFSMKENLMRNKKMRSFFNSKKMGTHFLVGGYIENQGKEDEVQVVEKSFLVVKPDNMTFEEFRNLILSQIKEYNQDGAILSNESGEIFELDKSNKLFKIGSKITVNKMSEFFSKYVKKKDVPFVFEGVQKPGSLSGYRIYKMNGILFPIEKFDDYKNLSSFYEEN